MRYLWVQLFYRLSDSISDLKGESLELRKAYLFRRPLMILLIVYAIGIGIAEKNGWLSRRSTDHIAHWNGQYVTITGIVHRSPDRRLKGTAFPFSVEMVETSTETRSAQGLVFIEVLRGDDNFIFPGDRLILRGKLQSPLPTKIPGTFDVQQWLAHDDIYSILYTGPKNLINVGDSGHHSLLRWGWKQHQTLLQLFQTHLSSEPASVLAGLAIGQRPHMAPEIKKIFMETGAMHVLVASGSNIAFVAGLAFLFSALFFRGHRLICLMGTLPFIWAYALLVGLDAPIVRSAAMATMGIVYYGLRRNDSPIYLLSFTAFFLLLIDPKTLFDVGFQMSFLTVFGLLHWMPHFESLSEKIPTTGRWSIRLLTASLTAQAWLLPISINIFRKIYPLAPIFNVAILPLSAGGLSCAVIMMIASQFQWIGGLVNNGVNLYLRFFIVCVRWMAHHSWGPFWLAPLSSTGILTYYTVCLCGPALKRSRLALGVSVIATIILVGRFLTQKIQPEPQKSDRITWIDVGRHNAILIEEKNQPVLLINPPPIDQADRLLNPYLAYKGISVSSTAVLEKNACLIYSIGEKILVMGNPLSIEHQQQILRRHISKIDLLQTRFSAKTRWEPEFIHRYHPSILVEIGYQSAHRPSVSPWSTGQLVIPQQEGVWVYEFN